MSRTPAKPRVNRDANVASAANLIGDETRARVLLALADGRALPASILATEAGVAASTLSDHLGRLLDHGMVTVEQHGRYRYYRLAGPEVASVLESLARFANAEFIPRSYRPGTQEHALRYARTCYDHLAGRLGVAVMSALLERGFLAGHDGSFHPESAHADRYAAAGHDVHYQLTPSGRAFMDKLGISFPEGSRPVIAYCVDWTEQRHHLRGSFGAALLNRFLQLGWIRRTDRSRVIRLTRVGSEELPRELGMRLPDPLAMPDLAVTPQSAVV